MGAKGMVFCKEVIHNTDHIWKLTFNSLIIKQIFKASAEYRKSILYVSRFGQTRTSSSSINDYPYNDICKMEPV